MLLTFRTVGGVLIYLLPVLFPVQQQQRRTTTTTTAGVATAFRLLHNQSTTGHADQHLRLLRRGQRGQRLRSRASLHVRQEEDDDDDTDNDTDDDNDERTTTKEDEEDPTAPIRPQQQQQQIQRQRKNNEEEDESRYYDPQQQQPQQPQPQQQNTNNYYNPDRAVNIVSELKSTAALFGAFAFGSLNLPNTLTVSESKVTSVTTSLSVSRPIPDSSLIKTFVVLDVTTLCCMISCIATSQLLIYKLTDGSYEDSIDSDLASDRSSSNRRDRTRNERGEISENDRDTEDRNTTAFVTRARDGTTNNTNPTQQHRRRHQRRDSRYTALGRLVTTYRNEFTVARLTFDVGLITLLLAVGVRSIAIFDQEIIVPIAVVIGSTSLFLIVAYCTTYVEVIRTAENSRRPTSTRNANANTKTNTVTTRNKNKNNTSMDTAKQDDSKRKNNRFGAASSNILVPFSLFAIGLALCFMIVLGEEGEGEGFESTGVSSSLPWLSSFSSSSSSSSSSLPSEFNFLSRFGGQQPRLPNYFGDATTSSGATKLKIVTDKLDSEKVKLVDNERNKQQQQQQQQRNNNDKKKKEYINSSRRRARIAATATATTTTPTTTPTDRRKTEVIEANRKKSAAAAAASAEDEARKKAGSVLEEEETMTREEK